MTIRITAVPRAEFPNSGYHPTFFAERRNDIVWALPNRSACIWHHDRTTFLAVDSELAKRALPIKWIRALALVEIFLRALFVRGERFVVHSFVFALPLFLARKPYCIVIHGTDSRHLDSRWGKAVARAADRVFGIGFSKVVDGIVVEEAPNVFSTAKETTSELPRYDALFILRAEPVKNPTYPFRLYLNAREQNEALTIGVVGLGDDFLSPDELAQLHRSEPAGARIEYLGRVSFEMVGRYLKASKVLILPSFSEGVPKVALEALARNVHVLVDHKLHLPASLSENVTRTDLTDWPAVLQLVRRLNREPRANHAAFAYRYLADSIAALDRIYASCDEESASQM